jgi:predicted ATP-grasp superfamily ATP-dependent carboligase
MRVVVRPSGSDRPAVAKVEAEDDAGRSHGLDHVAETGRTGDGFQADDDAGDTRREDLPGVRSVAKAGVDPDCQTKRGEFSIEFERRGETGDGVEVREIKVINGKGVADGLGERDRGGIGSQGGTERGIIVAMPATGMNGEAASDVENGDDSGHGMGVLGDQSVTTVLIHEYVTGGGLVGRDLPESWAVEGTAMRRALARDFAEVPGVAVVMTLDARLPDEPGPWTVVRIADPATILAVAAGVDHTAPIAPETGGVLADLARALPNSLGCTPAAIDLTADKLRLAAHLIELGLPTPRSITVRPRQGIPRDFDYPAVLKPIDGAGAVDTLKVDSSDDPILAAYPSDLGLLQPFIQGEPRSATFIAHPGEPPRLLGVGRQDIRVVAGHFSYRGGSILAETLPPDHPARRAVASITGLRGLIGVDYIHDHATGRAILIEINPRPTTSCVGLVATLGRGRLAARWLAVLGGSFVAIDPTSQATLHPVGFTADGNLFTSSRFDLS